MVDWQKTPKPWSIKLKSNITLIPAIHHSLFSTAITLHVLEQIQPDMLLLEYPLNTEAFLLEATNYYPLPIIMYDTNSLIEVSGLSRPIPTDFYLLHPGDPNAIALFWAEKNNSQIFSIDIPSQPDKYPVFLPDPSILSFTGFSPIINLLEKKEVSDPRGLNMGSQLKEIEKQNPNKKIVWIGGIWHIPSIIKAYNEESSNTEFLENKPNYEKKDWGLALLHPFSYPPLIVDPPFFVAKFWLNPKRFRHDHALVELLKEAKYEYQRKFDELISLSTLKRIIQYARNLALIDGRVFPSLFNIVESSKGSVDDDYALEVYRAAVKYPFYPENIEKISGIPLIDFGNILTPQSHLSITLKQRHPRPVLSFNPKNQRIWDLIKAPPAEKYPGEWKKIWDEGGGAFSYPPEDEFFEKFMRRVRKKLQKTILEEQAIVEPFTTSILDGIDWRETTRRIHEGKIFVKNIPKKAPIINTIILQFTKDDRPYEQVMTWYAEHEKESNLSLVSSNPADLLIGPGIGRAKYAGLISVFPPNWLVAEIPRDLTYSFLDRLIIAAIWSTPIESKYIGVISVEKPSLFARELAKKHGHILLHIPISAFPSSIIKKIRVFHVLSKKELREIAKEYIGY